MSYGIGKLSWVRKVGKPWANVRMLVVGQRRCPGQADCRILIRKLASADADVIISGIMALIMIMMMALKTNHIVWYGGPMDSGWPCVQQCSFLDMHGVRQPTAAGQGGMEA